MVALVSQASAQPNPKVPSFHPPMSVSVGSFPWGIDAADGVGDNGANGYSLDGYPDIAVARGQIDVGTDLVGGGVWDDSAPSAVIVYRNT